LVKVVGDRTKCIGAAVCSLTAPALFDQDSEEGLVVVLVEDVDESDVPAAWEAVDLCPSGALTLIDNEQVRDRA
jgi:ferredoxin